MITAMRQWGILPKQEEIPPTQLIQQLPIPSYIETPTKTLWQRVKILFTNNYPLKNRIETIEKEIQAYRKSTNPNHIPFPLPGILSNQLLSLLITLSKNKTDPLFVKSRDHLSKILNALSDQELDLLMTQLAETKLNQEMRSINLPLLPTCFELLSLERMNALLAFKKGEVEEIHQMAEEIAQFLPRIEAKKNTQGNTPNILQTFGNFLSSLAGAFSQELQNTFSSGPAQDRQEASERLNSVYTLIGTIGGIFATLLLLTGSLVTDAVVPWVKIGFIALGITALFMAIKSRHDQAPILSNGFVNLSKKIEDDPRPPIVGRHQEIQTVVQCLGNLQYDSRCPLLKGKSGVGKSEIPTGLAQEIAEGKHPGLAGKQVYHINTALLLESGGNSGGAYRSRLQTLMREIRGKEDQVILFFDEVDSLYRSSSNKGLPRQFQELLDNPHIHCIAAITDTGYAESIKPDDSLARRFRIVPVKEMSEEDTLAALRDFMTHKQPDVTLTNEAILEAIKLSEEKENLGKIAQAKDLLVEAANALRTYRGEACTELEKAQIKFDRARKDLLQSQHVEAVDKASLESLRIQNALIQELKEQVAENDSLIQERAILSKAQKVWRQALYNSAHDVVDKGDANSQKQFFFLSEYMQKATSERLRVQKIQMEEKKLPSHIDSDLIRFVRGNDAPPREEISMASLSSTLSRTIFNLNQRVN